MEPRIWLLYGQRAGDNAQIRAIADATAQDQAGISEFHLKFRPIFSRYPKALLGATLVNLTEKPDFHPPWPDMVIGGSRRTVPAALWIGRASGGRTKLVWLSRPGVSLDNFSLVLTTPQFMLPEAGNVRIHTLPFVARPRRESAPKRAVAMLGGSNKGVSMTLDYVDRFATAAARLASTAGLPLCVTTSPRSPDGAGDRLSTRLPEAEIHDFRARNGAPNPLRRWLSEAGACLVSGDSVAMLAEAIGTRAPVEILPVPLRPFLARHVNSWWGRRWFRGDGNRAWFRPPSDISAIHERLVGMGLAEWRDGILRIENAAPALEAEHAQAIARVRALLFDAPA